MAYSMEFRRAIAEAYDACHSSTRVAARFGCSEAWVRRLMQRRRENNTLEPFASARRPALKLDRNDQEALRALVQRDPRITLAELAKALNHKASVPTIWRTVCALGLRQKRMRPAPPPRQSQLQTIGRADFDTNRQFGSAVTGMVDNP